MTRRNPTSPPHQSRDLPPHVAPQAAGENTDGHAAYAPHLPVRGQAPRRGEEIRPAGDYQYGVGFSQSQGGYVDTAGRTAPGSTSDAYQGVRPWGPQQGVDGFDERTGADRTGEDHRRESRRDAAGDRRDFGLGPDIAPPRDFRGRGPKDYQRSDERLKEDISERLREHPEIDASEITVDVTGGRVSLSGEVDSRRTKHQVEDLVDACRGVQEIDNRLRIRSGARGPGD